ncbi:MAG: energy transducer TonB [Bacteroidales bacterium]|nr:energy transducer TonB [Bacteroidales bacterium]
MKQLTLITGILIILQQALPQVNDTNMASAPPLNEQSASEKELFKAKYEISGNPIHAKMLNEEVLRAEPAADSYTLNVTIPQGSLVNALKFFPEGSSWAIEFKNQYGFVPATSLMPIKDKASDETPAFDEPPELKTRITPVVPEEVIGKNIYGTVTVRAFIDKNGDVTDTEIAKSIPELDAAASEAIMKAKFKPARYKGKPVGIWMSINVNFNPE